MKKKGFTLIELLAVIVILAIIALITTPIVLNIIEKARKGATNASAMSYIKAVETYAMTTELDKTLTKLTVGSNDVTTLNGLIEVKGTKPTSGTVTVDKSWKVASASLVYEGYTVTYDGKDYTVSKGGESSSSGSSTPVVEYKPQYGTYVKASATDTHKGIVYLDPTDLSKSCNASNSVSTTETKTGCMKWYIYDDSGENYKMILDHNTTAIVKWNNVENVNVAYVNSYAKQAMDATLVSWKVTPRLITAEEINTITGKTGFDSENTSSWYYLDTNTQTRGIFDGNARSRYAWLFDNTYKCKSDSTDYGCTVEDNTTTYELYGDSSNKNYAYGYWIQDTVGTAGSGSTVWNVSRDGTLSFTTASNTNRSIRPVIEIAKTQVNS